MTKITCKTDLEKNVISETIFEREIALCKKLSKEKRGCNWGKCENCGVIPLLVKLHEGKMVEDIEDIKKLKKTALG